MNKIRALPGMILLLFMGLLACGTWSQPIPTATATQKPADTPSSVFTPASTNTPAPTNTPSPTYPPIPVPTLINELSNADVHWDGTYFGLWPTLTGTAAKQLLAQGDETVPALLESLSDPNKYVAAHVILTWVSGIRHELEPTWNGLEVELAADGKVSIDPAQQPTLSKRWQLWYKTQPHPTALPPAD